jgi:DNA-binding NarL/FixJ family response regulator
MGESRTAIVILDRDEMTRRGLHRLLQAQPGLHVIAESATAQQAAAQVTRLRPDVLVMDPVLPDASGVDLVQRMRAQAPALRIVVLLPRVEERGVVAAVRAGAMGIVSKDAPLAEICRAVRAAAAGEPVLDAPATAALLACVRRQQAADEAGEALTGVERHVLALVVAGRTNKQIAQALSMGEKTVKTRLARAFAKLHVTRRAQAAVVFVRGAGEGADPGSPPPGPESGDFRIA